MDLNSQHRTIRCDSNMISVQERAASLEHCPWCTSKGLTYALRSYRINLQESITLCTNPQCLFPLVSRSLEDVLASLVPVEPSVGSKRKNVSTLEEEDSVKPLHKRLRSSQQTQSLTDSLISEAECADVSFVSNGQHAAPEADDVKSNGYHRDSAETGCEPLQETSLESFCEEPEKESSVNGFVSTCSSSAGRLQSSSDTLMITKGNKHEVEEEDDFMQVENSPKTLNRCSSNQSAFLDEDVHTTVINTPSPQHNEQTARTGQNSSNADTSMREDTEGEKSETDTRKMDSDELVSVPSQLFWRNSNNLCWLDSLLVALVNCKSLRKFKAQDELQGSSVWRLLQRYKEICAAVKVHHQADRDGVVKLPHHVLQKADEDLQSLRMTIFKLLQPKLHCKLGRRETPVFAMPVLLAMDSWAEPLFQTTFQWEFKCSECKAAMTERALKTLPTFTNILPDWRPLHAVHSAPCNVCCKKNQRRGMILESVSPVFALHFVEGLPENDVGVYTFTFKGKRYSVTTVIQYKKQLKHFVTWIRNPHGSWVEFDDLKHPDCETHQKLPFPGAEMHVVFWEAEDDKEPRACSPSSTLTESPRSHNEMNSGLRGKDLKADQLLARSPDQSIITSHDDTDIVCALSASEDTIPGFDASIGSTTLLDTFEGLSHNDIVTLTLVEVKPDSELQPLNDHQQNQDLGVEIVDSTPDSSSTVMCNEMSQTPIAELPAASSSSESEDHLSSDPTFVPARRGRRTRASGVRAASKSNAKTAASNKTAPRAPVSSQRPKRVTKKSVNVPAQVDSPPVEATPQAPSVSSTRTSPPSESKDSPAQPQTADKNARWSFLLSKLPAHQVHASIPNPNPAPSPVTRGKNPTPPAHSTPNPARKQQLPGIIAPKPQLKMDKSAGLPIKAAEMYGAFGAKSAKTPILPPSAVLPCVKSNQPKPHSRLTNTTVMSGTSLPVSGIKVLHEISSSKKPSSQSPKVPAGLDTTEALRYKLIKKLKAKKKKLAKLNEMLSYPGGASLPPDSTNLSSPNTVTSSTYDPSNSICDDFLSDLLSPATTASNLSPDSTGFLEMLTNRQDGVNQLGNDTAVSQISTYVDEPHRDDFLEDFLSQVVAQRPTVEETEALGVLDFFV
ncbi:SUMO-specific isopeptidase USPL1 isoform X2 [Notolabrus celidotus]|uniref:SUMO-specific isopeptidase USPL1 isoform X2 n=1 Tax=Notolabrus celidotus TaxID=1203425 RepID=UPI00148F8478|nr:SUMO-specific isopeptidase USPL1 isoform X2 [Notolabrus celidotus]